MADDNVGETVTPHRARVNGAILIKFHQKPVCALGTVAKADGGGTAFQMKASDGQQINVRLRTPISEPLEGIIEVYGIGQGKNLIVADSYTTFPSEVSDKFDMNTYNEAIKAMHSVEDGNSWLPMG